jgi:putative membrane protein
MSVQLSRGSLKRVLILGGTTLACLAACSKGDTAADSAGGSAAPAIAADSTATSGTPNAAAGGMGDAQIAHVAVTANSADSAGGEMAKKSASAASVKEFGQMMITDHGALNKQAGDVATKASLTPADNPTSQSLKANHDQASQQLATMKGAAFDSAYIAHEVQMHQMLLDSLDGSWINAAQNADLKALLQQARGGVAAHLDRAKSIQSSLGKK